MKRGGGLLGLAGLLAAATSLAHGPMPSTPSDPAAARFFETKVRPVLAENCFKCHGPEKQKAGLRLDSRAATLKGGDSGPAVVPGQPESSLLIDAVNHGETLQMPPTGKLPAQAIVDLTAWVKLGAPWPGGQGSVRPSRDEAAGESLSAGDKGFWAFQPPRKSPLPSIRLTGWPRSPVDHFVLARLEANGLRPAPPADRRALLRRVTYDLLGLPPTPEEIEAFLRDDSADAYVKVVDRLLASPRYGERWGRHWLDVARYADTSGPRLGPFAFAYTYRDWVIRSFNEDLPYDQFLTQQIAADRIPGNTDRRNLAALGFLTVGRRNNRDTDHDVVDDWIDVVTRGTLGLSVSCARCHDHKFDPISTQDYYALHGIFLNSRRREVLPVIEEGKLTERHREYERAIRQREEALRRFRERKHAEYTARLRTEDQLAAYLLAAEESRRLSPANVETLCRDRDLNLLVVLRWKDFLDGTGASHDPSWAPWHALAALPAEAFRTRAAALARQFARQLAAADAPTPHPDPEQEALRQVLHGPDAPPNVPLDSEAIRVATEDLNLAIASLWARYAAAGAQPRAMAVEDAPVLQPSYVLVRGNPNRPGEQVPRRFLTILAGDRPSTFTDGSGRLELARAIATPDNPLTARVIVNRVWQHHFGAGIVSTPSDFGTRGEPPSHPELLDYLACQFVDDGWSIKKLHRTIVCSQTYQQASGDNPAHRRVDPENRLLWRMNRRRLDFEALRDTLLEVSGQLDLTMGGIPAPLFCQPAMRRRTVYGLIDRAQVPVALRAFDFANPDQHSPQRHLTTVPQQALFLMNSPFASEQARHLAGRSGVASEQTAASRVQQLYRLALGRLADSDELALALHFLEAGNASAPPSGRLAFAASAWQYGFGEYDEAKQQLISFQPFSVFVSADQQFVSLFQRFPVFTEVWQASHMLPDPVAGHAHLTSLGGEPGAGPRHAVVRRWVAPAGGRADITGSLRHQVAREYSDGIRAWIASSRHGRLAAWSLVNKKAETNLLGVEVHAGDTIDFIVDSGASPIGDEFTWSPSLRLNQDVRAGAGKVSTWDAAADFRGPPAVLMSPWEQLALVLLQTDEFVFID